MTTASAPGKLMLLGEHAVVYGQPCLVTAVDLRYFVTIERTDDEYVQVIAPDLVGSTEARNVPVREIGKQFIKETAYVEAVIAEFYDKYGVSTGLRVSTRGPAKSYGLGSSSAVSAATVMALAKEFGLVLSNKEMFDIAYASVLKIQRGKASGFDVASAIYGGLLYYRTGGTQIDSIQTTQLPIVIGYSGTKVGTVSLVEQVATLQKRHSEVIDTVYNTIGRLVEAAKHSLSEQDWHQFGELMNINQGFLDALGVNTAKLSSLIYSARDAGAFGAKLSGAGGGDCMFAITDSASRDSVIEAIQNAGGMVLDLEVNAGGVRIE
ncbi:MAG: mevalonate kinase [Chloroflexi bacterium]|nr:mevalonate kinase [Chloroflexota bacterium]